MEPVELYNPKSERYYTARTPVELNDLTNTGYVRADDASVDHTDHTDHVDHTDHTDHTDHVEVDDTAGAEPPASYLY